MNSNRQAPDIFDVAARNWLAKRVKKKAKIVWERDDGASIGDFIDDYAYKGSSGLFGLERRVLDHITSPVLDLGCGAGRVALSLCRAGHTVTGIDISEGILRIGKDSARNGKISGISLAQMSLNQLGFSSGAFSTAICMFNTIGVSENLAGLRNLLNQLDRLCSSGGLFIFTSIDVTKRRDYETYFIKKMSEGRDMGQIRMRIRFGKITGDWFDWLYVLPDDLTRIAPETGWEILDTIYDTADPQSYAAVLRKTR